MAVKMLPPLQAFDLHAAVIGRTGSGKSYLARAMVEQLLDANRRVMIIDPTGVWWGLRTGADGNPAGGYNVAILGGRHADIEITASQGAALGASLATQALPVIADVSGMEAEEQIEFVTDFLSELYRLNAHPLHLIIDEADEFAPQVQTVAGASKCLDQMARIVKRGRTRGFRVLMITQRPADLSKRVLAQISSLIIKKLTAPLDHKAVKGWIELHDDVALAGEVLISMPKLEVTQGWLYAPELEMLKRMSFPPIKTFDSMKAPDESDTLPEISRSKGLEALAAALAGGGALSDKLSDNGPAPIPKGWVSPEVLASKEAKAEQRGYGEGVKAERARVREGLKKFMVAELQVEGVAVPREAIEAKRPDDRPHPLVRHAQTVMPPRAIPPSQGQGQGQGNMPSAFASDPWFNAIVEVWPAKLTWGQIGAMIGKKASGGFWSSIRKKLIADGKVVEDASGRVWPVDPPALPKGVAAADVLSTNLRGLPQRLFTAIRKTPGWGWSAYAEELGVKPSGGFWSAAVRVLRVSELVTEDSEGLVRVRAELLKIAA